MSNKSTYLSTERTTFHIDLKLKLRLNKYNKVMLFMKNLLYERGFETSLADFYRFWFNVIDFPNFYLKNHS